MGVRERLPIEERRVGLRIRIGDKAVAAAVEDPPRIIDGVVQDPPVGHDAQVAVQGEVIEKEGPFRSDQTLDWLEEELISERGLETPYAQAEPGVVVDVDEHVEQRERVETVGERQEVAERLGDPAAEHPPLPRKVESVVDGVLAGLLIAAIFKLGQIVELKDELVIFGPDLEAGAEFDVGLLALQRRGDVEPGRWRGVGRH